jgi:hypothetical protein
MPIRAAWMYKRFAFRDSLRWRCKSWADLPYPPCLPRRAGVTRLATGAQLVGRRHIVSSVIDRQRVCAYTCSAIYQQFYVP